MGNGIGRISGMTDPTGDTTYCYERRGLLATTTEGHGYALNFGYDEDGNRDAMTYPSGLSVTYSYDFAGCPLSASAGATPIVTSATYLPFGPAVQLSFGNATTSALTFDSRYRPLRTTLTGPLGTIADYAYDADPVGNITEIHDQLDSSYNRDFGYDDLNRLITAYSGASLWGSGTYTYDRMGNMTSTTVGADPLSFSYVGSTPMLDTVTGTAVNEVEYDQAGNEVSEAREYGARNLLISINRPVFGSARWLSYGYDGRNLRVTTTWYRKGGGVPPRDYEQHSVYCRAPSAGAIGLDERSVFATFTGTEYLWFGAIPIAQISTNPSVPIRYTFTDHLGTPVLQTDPDAEIAWQADYDPYGQIFGYRTGSDTDPQVLRLPGQESDDYTAGRSGTYYNIFRWYRAGWGRYAQADPVGLHAGTNLFTYVHGNPISLRDPLGLFCTSDFVKNYLSGSG